VRNGREERQRQPRLRVAGDWTLVLSRGPAGKTATA
jgi:hypothetical protein